MELRNLFLNAIPICHKKEYFEQWVLIIFEQCNEQWKGPSINLNKCQNASYKKNQKICRRFSLWKAQSNLSNTDFHEIKGALEIVVEKILQIKLSDALLNVVCVTCPIYCEKKGTDYIVVFVYSSYIINKLWFWVTYLKRYIKFAPLCRCVLI